MPSTWPLWFIFVLWDCWRWNRPGWGSPHNLELNGSFLLLNVGYAYSHEDCHRYCRVTLAYKFSLYVRRNGAGVGRVRLFSSAQDCGLSPQRHQNSQTKMNWLALSCRLEQCHLLPWIYSSPFLNSKPVQLSWSRLIDTVLGTHFLLP